MPWTTLVRRINGNQSDAVGSLMVSARSPQAVADAQGEITALLKQRHHQSEQAEPDFQVRNLAEMQNAANEQAKTISALLCIPNAWPPSRKQGNCAKAWATWSRRPIRIWISTN